MSESQKVIHISLPESMHRAFKIYSVTHANTMSAIITDLVRNFLTIHEMDKEDKEIEALSKQA